VTTKDDIKGIFRQCLPAQLYVHIDDIVDHRKVLVRSESGVTLVAEPDWVYQARHWHYFVGLCSVVCATDVASVMYWTFNGGEQGFAQTRVNACVTDTVSAIRRGLTLMEAEPASFRHPLNLPVEIYRIEDPDAAIVAADTYRQYL